MATQKQIDFYNSLCEQLGQDPEDVENVSNTELSGMIKELLEGGIKMEIVKEIVSWIIVSLIISALILIIAAAFDRLSIDSKPQNHAELNFSTERHNVDKLLITNICKL